MLFRSVSQSRYDGGKVYDRSLDSIEFAEERVFPTINNEVANYIKEDCENDEDFKKEDFRALLIIDDLANELKAVKHTELTKLILKSRHLHLSIIMISHKFTYFQRIHRTNFSLEELTKSQEAIRLGIPNEPNQDHIFNLQLLCQYILQPVRDNFNLPVTVSSGYRSAELCEKIGSSSKSQHTKGEAADFEVFGLANKEVGD